MTDFAGPSSELWSDLRQAYPVSSNELATLELFLDGQPTGTLVALSFDGQLHLLIPLPHKKRDIESVTITLRGLRVIETTLKIKGKNKLYLDISTDQANENIFTVFANELAYAVDVLKRDPRTATQSIVNNWKSFWTSPNQKLSIEKSVGLFAEIWFLNRVLMPCLGPRVIHHWTGPEGERHDFQGVGLHIEVKATRNQSKIYRIHGHDQLKPPKNKILAFFGMQLSVESGGPDSLVDEVESCNESLSGNPGELVVFMEKIKSCGYTEVRKEELTKLRFRIRAADIYLIKTGFPEFPLAELPDGICKIDYDLDISLYPAMDPKDAQLIYQKLISSD